MFCSARPRRAGLVPHCTMTRIAGPVRRVKVRHVLVTRCK